MVDKRTKTSWLIISTFVLVSFFILFCESIYLYGFYSNEIPVIISRVLNVIVFNVAFVIIISLLNTPIEKHGNK